MKLCDRIRRVQFDGRIKTRTKRDIFHDSDGRTRIGHFRFPNPIQRAGSGIGKSHPFVRSAPSFRPDLRTASAVAHSGGQGWPVFGPPRQRRVASLTAASTAARSVASGTDPHQSVHQKARAHRHQKPRSRSIELLAAVILPDRYSVVSQLRSRFSSLKDPATSLSLSAFRSHGRRWPVAGLSARMPHLSGRTATCDGRRT